MTHIDAGVWISLPKYDWHYAVIMSRHVTHVTCHTCHKCVMRIIRHYLSTLRSLFRYHSLFELVLSSAPWSHIVLFIPDDPDLCGDPAVWRRLSQSQPRWGQGDKIIQIGVLFKCGIIQMDVLFQSVSPQKPERRKSPWCWQGEWGGCDNNLHPVNYYLFQMRNIHREMWEGVCQRHRDGAHRVWMRLWWVKIQIMSILRSFCF